MNELFARSEPEATGEADLTPLEPHVRRQGWPAALRPLLALWPHWPLALFLLGAGVLNLFLGLRQGDVLARMPGARESLPELSEQLSMSVLGQGAQAVLGGALVLTGLGLLWRLRIAWVLALFFLAVTLTVNVARGVHLGAMVLPGAVLLALVLTHKHFRRTNVLGNAIATFGSMLFVLAYGVLGAYLLGDGFDPPIADLATALYFNVITLSTVGYGDIGPVSAEARWFTMSLIVVGLSVFATAVVSILGPALSNQLHRILVPEMKAKELVDHVILLGNDSVALATARELERREVPFVYVLPPGAEPPPGADDLPCIEGDTGEDDALEKAQVGEARMVIAAYDDDGDNAFATLAAKELNPEVKVMALAHRPGSIRRLERSGADFVFAPDLLGGRVLADLVEGEEVPEAYRDLLKAEERGAEEEDGA